MALIDDIKTSLRITSSKYDAEAQMLIDAALFDMERAGVDPDLLVFDDEDGTGNGFVKQAVTLWCKANFGYDVAEADRFMAAYDRVLNALLNSSNNIAAIAEAEGDAEPEPGSDAGLGAGLGASAEHSGESEG